jgi:peptidoglycan/LPS O-acetylase OafA/YrhL
MTPTATPAPVGHSRLISLDLLRFLAIAMVLGRHMEAPPESLGAIKPLFDAWYNYGGLGVDLFLVLSGFLVSGLLFVEYKKLGEISVKRFYVRRAWRIYPAFYVLIVFSYLFSWLVIGWKMRDRQIFTEVFFLQNYQQAYWNHTWTLALEEHFYILLPLMLLGLTRRNPGVANPFHAVPWIVAASTVGFLAIRIVNYLVRGEATYSFYTHAWASHLRMDSLLFGVGLAYAYHFHEEAFRRWLRPLRYPLLAVGPVVLTSSIWLTVNRSSFAYHTIGLSLAYLGAAAMMVGLLMCQVPRNRVTEALAALGTHSYSIYLWHMALMYWAIPGLRDSVSWELRTLLYVVGAFVIGISMAKLLEAPLLRLRDRKHPSRIASQTVAQESISVARAA